MQRDKNMVETLKFVYVMILFLSLFLFTKDVDGGELFFHPFNISFWSF